MSSSFSDAKKLSATALSQHCRGRDSDWVISCSASRSVNSVEVYWVPRSEWKISPGAGRRCVDGHAERVADQLGAHVIGHRPADDPS